MEDFIPAISEQTQLNELGTLHHNTISRSLNSGEAVAEPRPTLSGNTKVATGSYGRGVFTHRGLPLYVTESRIATSLAGTDIDSTELNPNASASFGILDSGSNRITLIQNAGYDSQFGSIWYGSDENTYQVNTYNDTGNSFDLTSDSSGLSNLNHVFASPDGNKLYALDNSNEIYEFDFDTNARVSSLDFKWSQALPGAADPAISFCLTSDGLKLWLLTDDTTNIKIQEIVLNTAWDITSVQNSVNNTLIIEAQLDTASDICASFDDSRIYVIDTATDDIFQYNVSTPGDLNTASYASKSLDLSSQSTSGWDTVLINPAGDVLYAGTSGSVIYEYSLGTAKELDSGSYASRSNDVGTDLSINLQSTAWAQSGEYLYVASTVEDIYEMQTVDTFTEVTDADSPGTPGSTIMVRGIAVLNGNVYAMDTDCKISNSDNLDVTSWNALNFLSAERKPDFGCYIGSHKDHIFALNTRSLEFFYDAANPSGSPLTRRQDVYYNVGCVFPNSVTQLGDQVYFFGTNEHGDTDVYVLDNFALAPLGNEYVKTLLRDLDTPVYSNPYTSDPTLFRQTLVAYSTPDNGVCLNMTINGKTYNYCTGTGLVSKWYPGENVASATGLFTGNWNTGQILPITSIYSGSPQGSAAYAMLSNGYVTGFTYNGDLQDIGGSTAADSFFYTPKWNAGSIRKKRVNRYDLHQYPSYDESLTTSTMTFQWVDLDRDIGASLTDADFNTGRTFSGIDTGQRIMRCGMTRERIHKFTFTPAKYQLVSGLKIYFEPVE